MREHARFVGRTAVRAGVPSADIDDITQAVLLILWHRRHHGDEVQQVRAWLGTVTRRVAWAHRRAAEGRAEVSGGDAAHYHDEEAPAVDELVDSMAAIRLVHEVLAQVAPARRAVLQRYEIDGESMPEIAAALGISVNTGHSRLRLAREDFRRLLEARLRRDERCRRGLLLPFFFQQSEVFPSEPRAPSTAGLLLLLLLALAAVLLDTRWGVVLPSDATGLPATVASSPEDADAPSERPPEPADAPAAAPPEPEATSTPQSPQPQVAPPRPAPGPAVIPGPPRSAAPSSPRRRRSLETERILLDTADRMAAEGQSGAVKELLLLYSIHAPDNPMPSTRAAVSATPAAPPPAVSAPPPPPQPTSAPVPAGTPAAGATSTSTVAPGSPRPAPAR